MDTPEDIENKKVEIQKELNKQVDAYHEYNNERLVIKKQICDLQNKLAELQIAIGKSRRNIDRMRGEIKVLEDEFWARRRG